MDPSQASDAILQLLARELGCRADVGHTASVRTCLGTAGMPRRRAGRKQNMGMHEKQTANMPFHEVAKVYTPLGDG